MQVVGGFQFGGGGLDGLAHRTVLQSRSNQGFGDSVQAHRNIAGSAQPDGERRAAAVRIQRDLRRRRDEREIALARRHLVEAGADAALGPDRESARRSGCRPPAAP